MFVKLLKHEWRAVRGILGLLCAIILGCGAAIGGVMHNMLRLEHANTSMPDVMVVLCTLVLSACVIGVAVCSAGSLFLVVWRFYKSRFTDEGYLTFTLPVTNHQILLSSIALCVIAEIIVMLAALAAVGIASAMFLLAIPDNQLPWEDMVISLQNGMAQLRLSFATNWELFTRVGISGILGAFGELMVLLLAVTVGAILAKKHKILAAVAVYYGISMVQSFVFSVFALSAATAQDVNILVSIPSLMGLLLTIGSYFAMHWLISRKLNLT